MTPELDYGYKWERVTTVEIINRGGKKNVLPDEILPVLGSTRSTEP